MLRFTIRRLLVSIPLLLVSTFIVFVLVSATGNPLNDLKTRNPPPPASTIAAKSALLHLDQNVFARYWWWLTNLVLHGNWGPLVNGGTPIGEAIHSRIFVTLRLVTAAMLLAVILAIIIGVLSAVFQYSFFDYTATFGGFLFLSLPVFWFAILLKQWGTYFNNWTGTHFISTIHQSSIPAPHGGWATTKDIAGHLILPTIVLAMTSFAAWSRFQRGSMLEVLNSDYIRLARAKGLSRRRVMVRHALRTALIPLATVTALDIGAIIGGAVITETVFQWQGMGLYLEDSLVHRETYAVVSWLVISAFAVILFNLIADLLYAVLDPRIRYE